jgi:hypothetical protein
VAPGLLPVGRHKVLQVLFYKITQEKFFRFAETYKLDTPIDGGKMGVRYASMYLQGERPWSRVNQLIR